MTSWTAFASVAGVVTVLLLLLSHTTSQRFGDDADEAADNDADDGADGDAESPVAVHAVDSSEPLDEPNEPLADPSEPLAARSERAVEPETRERAVEPVAHEGVAESETRDGDVSLRGGREEAVAREFSGAPSLSQPMLLLNVALSQGVFALALVASAVLADVPLGALGVAPEHVTAWFALVGAGLGVALFAANEAGSALADAAGLGRSEELREFLAPDSRFGWIVLLGGVLPVVAAFEELLFRGVLVGALATGFGTPTWALVVGSSILFGLGHGAQGRLGVLVTGALGIVLATAFVLTGSLLVVVVAHYLVNALEFVVHEGLIET